MARVVSHTEKDDLCEISGDLTEAYAETCDFVSRTMRFEPNRGDRGTLTVTDRIEPKNADAEVKFLIHCQSEPVIGKSGIIIIGRKRDLHVRVASPDNVKITAIGGEGHRFENDGVDYLPKVDTSEAGWGRIEITSRGKTDFGIEFEIRRKD